MPRPQATSPASGRTTSPTRSDGLAWASLLGATVVALVAVVVYRGALAYFFAQDDFDGLARARGLLPRVHGLWRVLSLQYYYDLMAWVGGLNPLPYRVSSLALHALTSILAFRVLRFYGSAPAATLGAVFFAVHPALFTGLYWISAVNTILATGFALGAFLVARSRSPMRWLAVPLFVLSLLSKESTVGLPLVVAALYVSDRRSLRDPLVVVLLAIAVGFAVFLRLSGAGFGTHGVADAPYHFAVGPHVVANLLTYVGWGANCWYWTVTSVAELAEPKAMAVGAGALVLWGLGFMVPDLRRRKWWIAAAWFLAWIAPVLLLPNHTYHYYLYGPLVGFSIAITLGWETLQDRLRAAFKGLTTVAAAALVLLMTWNGVAVVRKIEMTPFVGVLRSDPSVDRAIIARNSWHDLRDADLPPGTVLRFWSPTSIQLEARMHPDADPRLESYWEQNVRSALLDGLGVRVLFPTVDSVTFVRTLDVNDRGLYAVYRIDGSLAVATPGYLDSLTRAHGGLPGS